MALGVLNNLPAMYAENYLNNTSSSLQTVLQQLSSGSRINSGADDAAGLSLVNGLAANSAALTQSTTNASEGVGLLKVADGALSQVSNLLNRAVTLATEARTAPSTVRRSLPRTRSTSRFFPRSTTSGPRPPTTRIRSLPERSRASISIRATPRRPARRSTASTSQHSVRLPSATTAARCSRTATASLSTCRKILAVR